MTHQRRRPFAILIAVAVWLGASLACSLPSLIEQSGQPVAPVAPTAGAGEMLPTSIPRDTATRLPASVTPARAARTPVPATALPKAPTELPATTAVPAEDQAAPAAPGPARVVITDADIQSAIDSGVVAGSGVDAQNLRIRFTGGKTQLTADRIAYGLVRVENLVMIGHLVARDGQIQMETESVSPGGLVTAMIPTIVNQAFKQYTSQWYIEDVETKEGQIELTVR